MNKISLICCLVYIIIGTLVIFNVFNPNDYTIAFLYFLSASFMLKGSYE